MFILQGAKRPLLRIFVFSLVKQFIVTVPEKYHTAQEFWSQRIPVPFDSYGIDRASGNAIRLDWNLLIDVIIGIVQCTPALFSNGRGKGQIQTFVLPDGRWVAILDSVFVLTNKFHQRSSSPYQVLDTKRKFNCRYNPQRISRTGINWSIGIPSMAHEICKHRSPLKRGKRWRY